MAGDQVSEQFVRLLSKHDRRLSAFILSLVPNWSDAEEIAQEVRVRLWQQYGNYDETKDFGAWSRTIAYYQVLTYRQSKSKQSLQFSQATLDAIAKETASDEGSHGYMDARHRALEGCLKAVSDTQRSLLIRWNSGKESTRQIADALGRSLEATRRSILRIRRLLAECVTRALRREENG